MSDTAKSGAEANIENNFPVFDVGVYEQRHDLTDAERETVRRLAASNGVPTGALWAELEELLRPLQDALDFAGRTDKAKRRRAMWRIVGYMDSRGRSYWSWSTDEWYETIQGYDEAVARYAAAIAYLIGNLDGERALEHIYYRMIFARWVLGAQAVNATIARVQQVVSSWGYTRNGRSWSRVNRTVCEALVLARSTRLENISMTHLKFLLEKAEDQPVRSAVALLSRVLAHLGIVEDPILRNGPVPWGEVGDAADTVSEPWLGWCRRWRDHSTLAPQTRRSIYSALAQIGRWLAMVRPEIDSPEQWDAGLAAEFVAAVDRKKVGDWSHPKWVERYTILVGKPIKSQTKVGCLSAARTFLRDCQEWGWIPETFSPGRCLRTPRSISNLLGPDPKPIDDNMWARLLRAALDLERSDFTPGHMYPIELDRAMAAVWVCSGLRADEIVRLRVGCVRWQKRDKVMDKDPASTGPENGAAVPEDALCFLDIPVTKTSSAFTRPVPAVAGRRIEEWERVRFTAQNKALDAKTGEQVHFLFAVRNRSVPTEYLNQALIPALCRRAGIPQEDASGRITSHRARATVASQLYNAPNPWTLPEIQVLLGHQDPASTRYYTKVDLTKLANRFAESGYLERNLATVEVLLDVERLATGEQGDALYYDLGHGLCANPYWHKCAYRLACVKCPMYVAGDEAQYVRSKQGIKRMLETVPITDEERRVAEGDEEALDKLLSKGDGVPVPKSHPQAGGTFVPLSKKDDSNRPPEVD